MQRPWAVRPDQGDVLSREALISALIDAATMLDIAGGCLEVVVGRMPTGVPGEMVMTGAMLCWRDRTDAKPQAEQAVQVVPAPVEQMVADAEPKLPLTEDEKEAILAEAREQIGDSAMIDPDDGFDYSKLPDEDLDESPVPAA